MLTHYNDNDETPPETLSVTVKREGATRVSYYLLDGSHNGECIREEVFTSNTFTLHLEMKLFDTYLIKFTAI